MIRKFYLLITLSILIFSQLSHAQEIKPNLLMTPTNWKFERMDLPLDFAPELSFEGYEELRFAPGMFDTESPYYFTYLFALEITNQNQFTESDLVDFIEKYYRGLSHAVGESKNMDVNMSKIKVRLKKVNGNQTYHSTVNFFDTFTDGREILLNMELEVFENLQTNSCYILAFVSPHKKANEIWTEMYHIRKDLNFSKISKQQ